MARIYSFSIDFFVVRRSVYRELFDLESSIKHDADLPLMITDAINDVDIRDNVMHRPHDIT